MAKTKVFKRDDLTNSKLWLAIMKINDAIDLASLSAAEAAELIEVRNQLRSIANDRQNRRAEVEWQRQRAELLTKK